MGCLRHISINKNEFGLDCKFKGLMFSEGGGGDDWYDYDARFYIPNQEIKPTG